MDIFRRRPINGTLFRKNKDIREQGLFLKRLGMLLGEGFSLKHALDFLYAIASIEKREWILKLQSGLKQGQTLHEELKKVGFSDRTCTQIYLSSVHGQFASTIERCGKQLIEQVERRKKLMQVIHYPLLLLLFTIAMLFAMRFILLPHIQYIVGANAGSMDWMTRGILLIVNSAPFWIVGGCILVTLVAYMTKQRLKKKSAIERLNFYCSLPLVQSFLLLYWTQFFLFEWGQLLKNGCSMREIVRIMQMEEVTPLLQEVGKWMEKEMAQGKTFKEALLPFKFLKTEVGEIILHGEVSGKLGSECLLFAQECEEEIMGRMERLMEKIQPLVFIFVALMIIAIYGALLLPTFSLLEGL